MPSRRKTPARGSRARKTSFAPLLIAAGAVVVAAVLYVELQGGVEPEPRRAHASARPGREEAAPDVKPTSEAASAVGGWGDNVDEPAMPAEATSSRDAHAQASSTSSAAFASTPLIPPPPPPVEAPAVVARPVTPRPLAPRPTFDGPFHVSPQGSDRGTGKPDAPFKTLERARDAVRRCAARGKKRVEVVLAAGRYRRTFPFELGGADGGAPGAEVVYRAADGAEVIVDGGIDIPVEACVPVTDPQVKRRLVQKTAGRVRRIDLAPFGITQFGAFGPRGFSRAEIPAPNELFVNGEPQRIARWPNDGRIKLGKVIDRGSVPRTGDKSNRGATFKYENSRATRWTEATDFYVSGIFGKAWADDTIKVAKLDTKAGTIRTTIPHLYGFHNTNFSTWSVVNLLEEIDAPGEYFIDKTTRTAYLYPATKTIERIQLSVMTEPLVRVRGASHLRIEGLVFENARGRGIEVRDGTRVVIADCVLRNLGGRAIAVSGGTRHTVTRCDVYDTGSGGVSVSGGNRKNLTPARHLIENCDIHRVNRWYWTYKPCVNLQGVGNAARHNHLHHVPGQAILFGGNDHLMEYNQIDHCVTDMSDMGSIYTGRNPSVMGHVIRYNFFHDMDDSLGHGAGVQAIFIDDDSLYTAVIYGNIFYKTGSNAAIKFNGGGGSSIANNIFLDCPRAVQGGHKKHFDRAIKRMLDRNWQHKTYDKVTKQVDIRAEPYKSRYPYLLDTFMNKTNVGTPQWNNWEAKNDYKHFGNARALDFRLRRGSPILRLVAKDVTDRVFGARNETFRFEPIPFDKIGLRRGEGETPEPIQDARYLPPTFAQDADKNVKAAAIR